MLSKNKRFYNPEDLPAAQRVRRNIESLYSKNELPATLTQEFFDDLHEAGLPAFHDVAQKSKRRRRRLRGRRTLGGNLARNLRNKLIKNKQWPPLYWAQVRVWNLKEHKEELQWLAFLLPHELLETLADYGDIEKLLTSDLLDDISKEHLVECQRKSGRRLIPLGLWGDGVPCNWDKSESVDTFSMNLPGIGGEHRALRIPITALSHKQVTQNTYQDILGVIAWSLQWAGAQKWPPQTHDKKRVAEI